MYIMRNILLPSLALIVLAGCAGTEPVERRPKLTIGELGKALGCEPDEIPFCVDVDCALTDYYCADKAQALGTISPEYRE